MMLKYPEIAYTFFHRVYIYFAPRSQLSNSIKIYFFKNIKKIIRNIFCCFFFNLVYCFFALYIYIYIYTWMLYICIIIYL